MEVAGGNGSKGGRASKRKTKWPNRCRLLKYLHMKSCYSVIIIDLICGMFFNKISKKKILAHMFLSCLLMIFKRKSESKKRSTPLAAYTRGETAAYGGAVSS